LDAWNVLLYILHDLEMMTNNMGQAFGEEKQSHVEIQYKSLLVHTTLSLNNYAIHINEINK
jgi:hypothetical protein